MALFESYERRIDKINEVLNSYGIASLEEAEKKSSNRDMSLVHESVTEEEIAKIISRWTGIPVSKLSESERQKTLFSGHGRPGCRGKIQRRIRRASESGFGGSKK